jgi:pimeloyl-ACP methyl ester carboxylesterase
MRSRYVDTRAGRIHAYDAEGTGDLPTMVLLHGIGSAATSYGPLLTRLRRHARRVVAPELPGHGFSAEPAGTLTPERLYQAVRDALDILTPEPIVLTGHSLGGGLALKYALENPDRVKALVLLSPAGARTSYAEWRALLDAFELESKVEALELLGRL